MIILALIALVLLNISLASNSASNFSILALCQKLMGKLDKVFGADPEEKKEGVLKKVKKAFHPASAVKAEEPAEEEEEEEPEPASTPASKDGAKAKK